VTSKGVLWAWGNNHYVQLGITGLESWHIVPTLVKAKDVFGGSLVRMVVCGDNHTLIVMEEGTLWTSSEGENSVLNHNNINNWRVQTLVEAHHFGNTKVVSVSGGYFHSEAVTELGGLYTWGWGQGQTVLHAFPAGIGHNDMLAKLVPTCVAQHLLQGACVGRCHFLPPLYAFTFVMGTHTRFGSVEPTAVSAGGGNKRSSGWRARHQLVLQTPAQTVRT